MDEETAPYDIPENLTTVYKKNGSFDQQRKSLLEEFRLSETHANLLLKLKVLVESKIQNDPSILLKNKGMMSALIQGEIMNMRNNQKNGAMQRSDFLDIVERDIQEKIIDSRQFHDLIKGELHAIRRDAMGISQEEYDKQSEEFERGSNSNKSAKEMRSSVFDSLTYRRQESDRRRESPSLAKMDKSLPALSKRVSKPAIPTRIDALHQGPRNFATKPRDDDQTPPSSQRLRY